MLRAFAFNHLLLCHCHGWAMVLTSTHEISETSSSRSPKDEIRYYLRRSIHMIQPLFPTVCTTTALLLNQNIIALFLSSTSIANSLSLPTHLLLLLLPTPLPLLFQKVPLVLSAHAFQLVISHLLFLLLALQSPFLRLLLVA